jgi:hypothetical protein
MRRGRRYPSALVLHRPLCLSLADEFDQARIVERTRLDTGEHCSTWFAAVGLKVEAGQLGHDALGHFALVTAELSLVVPTGGRSA